MSDTELLARLEQLEQLVPTLLAERDELARDNEMLANERDQLDTARRTLTEQRNDLALKRDEYKKLYELVLLELERTRRQLFGRKAEHVDAAQTQLAFAEIAKRLAALDADKPKEDQRAKGKGRGRSHTPHGRRPLPEHIPVERIVLEPENVEGLEKIGEEVSETLERLSASYVRVEVVRPKYARPKSDGGTEVVVADMPGKPVERGLCGPGLMARTIVAKYADHLPLNRQSVIYQRERIDLARSSCATGSSRPTASPSRSPT